MKEFCDRLRSCRDAMKKALVSPGPQLAMAVQTLIDTAKKYAKGPHTHTHYVLKSQLPGLPMTFRSGVYGVYSMFL